MEGCYALQTVTLGRCVRTIGDRAFAGCNALAEIRFSTSQPPASTSSAFDDRHFDAVTLRNARGFADGFKSVSPWSMFTHWRELELTTGNRFWETIDAEGTQMSFIIYDEGRDMLQVGDGERAVDSLRAGALDIPAHVRGMNVNIIGDDAFKDNNLLTAIALPATLTSVWDNAFDGCSGISEIELPWRVSYLGTRAFAACKGLRKLTFSKSIRTIGSFAFAECPGLESIYIPCTAPPELPDDAFVTTIRYSGYDLNVSAGDGVYKGARLYVPYGCRVSYATAPGWSLFRNIVETTFDGIADMRQLSPGHDVVCDLQGRVVSTTGTGAVKNGILDSKRVGQHYGCFSQ